MHYYLVLGATNSVLDYAQLYKYEGEAVSAVLAYTKAQADLQAGNPLSTAMSRGQAAERYIYRSRLTSICCRINYI